MYKSFQNTRLYITVRAFLQQLKFWDNKTSGHQILVIFREKLFQFDLDVRAAAVAYNFTLAVFPTIIFLFSLLPYIPIRHLDYKIIDFLQKAIPSGLSQSVIETIMEIANKRHGNVLSLGFILALYASTSGISALMKSFNLTYKTVENRGFIKSKLIAVMMNFLLTLVLVVAIIFIIIGRLITDYYFNEGILSLNFTFYALKILTYLVIFSVFFITISIIYYYGPAIQKKWNFFSIGSLIASVLTILVTNLFSYYLANFANYNKIYGSIGTVIALMVWLYLIALILILGFEVNATIDHAKTQKNK